MYFWTNLFPFIATYAHNDAYLIELCTIPTVRKKTRRFSNHVSRLLSRSHTFAIIVILDLKIHQSMWKHWPFFPKTWTKGHWPLDDLWPHVCRSHMGDSTQGSLCPRPMTIIHQCMWIQWSILQNTTYMHILHIQSINHSINQSLFQYHHKKNKIYNLHQNIYNTNKHDIDIEEMAKGQVGLKWPPPI